MESPLQLCVNRLTVISTLSSDSAEEEKGDSYLSLNTRAYCGALKADEHNVALASLSIGTRFVSA